MSVGSLIDKGFTPKICRVCALVIINKRGLLNLLFVWIIELRIWFNAAVNLAVSHVEELAVSV